jgi:hypothetical protein
MQSLLTRDYGEMLMSQQLVHMGRFGSDGILLETLLDTPTAKVDISFLTSP